MSSTSNSTFGAPAGAAGNAATARSSPALARHHSSGGASAQAMRVMVTGTRQSRRNPAGLATAARDRTVITPMARARTAKSASHSQRRAPLHTAAIAAGASTTGSPIGRRPRHSARAPAAPMAENRTPNTSGMIHT